MREGGLNWDEVHSLTLRQLMWVHKQATVWRLKFLLPLHGVDTREMVREIESGDKPGSVSVMGYRKLSKDEMRQAKEEMERKKKKGRKLPEGTLASLRQFGNLMNKK